MSETDQVIIGVQSCGCITLAVARPGQFLSEATQRSICEIVEEGGQILRTTVGEARAMPHFLEPECPHDPCGWEPVS